MRLSTRNALSSATRSTVFTLNCQRHIQITWRCYSDTKQRTYDEAINCLNTLQTPYAELKRQWDAGITRGPEDLEHTKQSFLLMGYQPRDLNNLNIVHVAGTKGKGTVCAYVESILNQYRLWALEPKKNAPADQSTSQRRLLPPSKIGLYTSPHLVSVRERIRIDSAPISEELFTKYFFEVWDKLCVSTPPETLSKGYYRVLNQKPRNLPPKPVYFRFLTLMSFHVFLSEGVDIAIYETGMGGEYDATNIIPRPAVTGISALGIDHTFHLGNTIESIAWHKAGIFKEKTPAYTIQQPWSAMAVLSQRADKARTRGFICVDEERLLEGVNITPDAPHQKQNAALAIALSRRVLGGLTDTWASIRADVRKSGLPERFKLGLENIVSRGRCEVRVQGDVTWYLDGAHTSDSIAIASKWFSDEVQDKPEPKILIFNQQGHREMIGLLDGLYAATKDRIIFDHVIFCPSLPPASSTRKDHINHQTDLDAISNLTIQHKFAERWTSFSTSTSAPKTQIKVLPSLEEAFEYVNTLPPTKGQGEGEGEVEREGKGVKARVLVTGSIHLVGRALGILEEGGEVVG